MQNSFTSGLLGTQSLPIIDILFVFVCSIPILIVMEIFKKVKFRR